MTFFDPTNNFIKNIENDGGYAICFTQVSTNKTVCFKAFITSWEDSFEQDWKNYATMGRMDDIKLYSKTSRTLNFAIDIPSADKEEAVGNFYCIQKLIQMTYPIFETIPNTSPSNAAPNSTAGDVQSAVNNAAQSTVTSENSGKSKVSVITQMGAPPFFMVKFANWAKNARGAFGDDEGGLHGVIKNIKFTPEFSPESSGFYGSKSVGTTALSNMLVPKTMKLSISMNVIHVEDLGFIFNQATKQVEPRTANFPYSAQQINEDLQQKKFSIEIANSNSFFSAIANKLNEFTNFVNQNKTEQTTSDNIYYGTKKNN